MADVAQQPIPFQALASGVEQLGGASPRFINALQDASGTIRARPGIAAWADFPTTIPNASPVVGMCIFGDQLVYVTEDRTLWAWQPGGAVVPLSDGTAATKVDGELRPVMQAFRSRIIVTGGGAPQTWTGTGYSARLSGSPPDATHVAALATRALLNVYADPPPGTFQWSGLGDSALATWDALNYTEAEARPDALVAIHDNTNELFAFGSETLQVYSPDPAVGFASGRAMNLGLLAPYSVVRIDDSFGFLDRERRIVITDGRSFQSINDDLAKTFDGLPAVDDCWAFRGFIDQWDICGWMFPTDGRGYLLERGRNQWCEYREFGSHGWQAPSITCVLPWPERNVILVGMSTGQIAQFDADTYTDLGNNLKVELVTGFIDRGSMNYKLCGSARFKFRRGATPQSGTAPKVLISYRDDLGAFNEPEENDLGLAGDYDPIVEVRSAGRYQQRQWRLTFDADAAFSFVGAEETFVVADQ